MAKPGIPKTWLRPREAAKASLSAPLVIAAKVKSARRKRIAPTSPRPSDPEFWTVINDVADPAPIALAELDAIERYFSGILDAVFDHSRKSSF